ncbi:unnamed protein product [Penicillium salamii]|nr:unnamed protein product [Penicillium salamii]
MSTLDTESNWKKLKGQLNIIVRSNYYCLNIKLNGISNIIDNMEIMNNYYNLVLG